MKDLSSVSPLLLQHSLDKSEQDFKKLRLENFKGLRNILQKPITMYYNLTRDLPFNDYAVLMRVSVSRKYKNETNRLY